MVLGDSHIEFLKMVAKEEIALWYAPGGARIVYVHKVWGEGHAGPLNQKVAAQVKALGLTRVEHIPGSVGSSVRKPTTVRLTEKGTAVLQEELETWAND